MARPRKSSVAGLGILNSGVLAEDYFIQVDSILQQKGVNALAINVQAFARGFYFDPATGMFGAGAVLAGG